MRGCHGVIGPQVFHGRAFQSLLIFICEFWKCVRREKRTNNKHIWWKGCSLFVLDCRVPSGHSQRRAEEVAQNSVLGVVCTNQVVDFLVLFFDASQVETETVFVHFFVGVPIPKTASIRTNFIA